MLELVVVLCLSIDPVACTEKKVEAPEGLTMLQCMMVGTNLTKLFEDKTEVNVKSIACRPSSKEA